VIAPAILVSAAVLLLCAAARELLASRGSTSASSPGDRTGNGALDALAASLGARARSGSAALRLGIPARLRRAGLDSRVPLAAVLLAKAGFAAVGALAALAAAPAAPGRLSVLVLFAMPAAGFVVPDALLERRARRRALRLGAALPDALDLLAVSAASGRSPAAGFAEIARASDGPLAEELRALVAELSCGRSLPQAMRELRRRVPGSPVAALCASLERSARFGSPLADQLRRQSTALRRSQRRAVEERAARAAPKIQLVVALVLVPSVLLMIAAGLIANADTLLAGF
jgi:tight adherence protein C